MSGCFGNHPIDRWMESQLNRYLDSCDGPPDEFEFEFNHRLKTGGTVNVKCEAEHWTDRDEDGVSSGFSCKVKRVYWTFNKDVEAELNDDAMSEIENRAEDVMKEEVQNF